MLQALNGFLLILTCDGEVFFATHSIESYLGFHQVRNTHFESICLVFVKILYSVIFNVYLHSQLVGWSRQECQFRSTCHVYASSPLLTQHRVFHIFPRLSNLVNVPIVSSNYRVECKSEISKILPIDSYLQDNKNDNFDSVDKCKCFFSFRIFTLSNKTRRNED